MTCIFCYMFVMFLFIGTYADDAMGEEPSGVTEEVIANGDFSIVDEDGFPEGFHVSRFSGDARVDVDEQFYRSSGRSVVIDGEGQSRTAVSTSRIDIVGGKTYRFEVSYRSPVPLRLGGSRHIIARLQTWNERGQKVLWDALRTQTPDATAFDVAGGENLHLYPAVEVTTDDWYTLEATFRLPDDATTIQVNLFNWFGHDAVWYADVFLVELADGDAVDWEEAVAVSGFDHPTPVLAGLREEHPRLLATLQDFDRIKDTIYDDHLTVGWFAALQSNANALLHQATATYELPDGVRLLSTSRRVLDRVETLAMAYRLTEDRAYAARAWDELTTAAHFPDWNPSHFLDTAEMTRAFAIGYDWLYDVWTEEEKEFLRTAIVEKELQPALAGYKGTAPWRSQWARRTNNWNFVVNSGITMGALAIAESEPDLAEEIIREGLYSVNFAIDRFAPDGGWDEGVGYWHYSVRYLIPYISALETALDDDFGLADTVGIAETGYFPIYMTGPTGTFNFADSGSSTISAPELFWLDQKYGIPAYSWWQRDRTSTGSGASRSLLWYAPGAGAEFQPDIDGLPLDRYFRQVEVVSFRSGWEDRRAAFVALKAGINAMHHNDLDVGTFVFDALGVRWVEALGADDYNLPGYFDYNVGRWNYYRKRTEGRNTIVLNPGKGPGQDLLTDSPARFVLQRSTEGEAIAVADLTPAYASHARHVHRGVALFDRRRQLLIQDEIKGKDPVEFWSFMHTKAQIDIDTDGREATLRQGKLRMIARILSPSDAKFISMPASPLPAYPDPPGQHDNAGVRKLAVQMDDVTDMRLVVQLTPLEGGEYAPFTPEVIPLDRWHTFSQSEQMWGPMPRVSVHWPTADRNGTVYGRVPVELLVDGDEHGFLDHVRVQFDEEIVHSGRHIPEELILDTTPLDDGWYELLLEFHLDDGSAVGEAISVHVENTWHLVDEQLPPLEMGFFGTVDRAKTVDASSGWTYATDDDGPLFGDVNRRVRKENSREHLIWEAPFLESFRLRIYAATEKLQSVLQLALSEDGQKWVDVPYSITVEEEADNGMVSLAVTGSVAPTEANLFRLTLAESSLDPGVIQVGSIELRGRK